MTKLPKALEDWIKKFSLNKFPCEKPCDSYGVCTNCTDAALIRIGARSIADHLMPLVEAAKEVKSSAIDWAGYTDFQGQEPIRDPEIMERCLSENDAIVRKALKSVGLESDG